MYLICICGVCVISASVLCVGEMWRVPLFMEHPGYINATFANVSQLWVL